MILECPHCSAKFSVPDTALGTQGRSVRCSQCGHTWHASLPEEPVQDMAVPADASHVTASSEATSEPDAAAAADEEVRVHAPDDVFGYTTISEFMNAPEEVRQARLRMPKKIFFTPRMRAAFMGAAYCIGAILFYVVWSVKASPEQWGFYSSQGFSFEKMQVEKTAQLGGDRFSNVPLYNLQGSIRNTSDVPRPLPNVRVTLKNGRGNILYAMHHSNNKIVAPGEAVSFLIEKQEVPHVEGSYFVVEAGNWLELKLRKVDMRDDESAALQVAPAKAGTVAPAAEPEIPAVIAPENTPLPAAAKAGKDETH